MDGVGTTLLSAQTGQLVIVRPRSAGLLGGGFDY